jgi:hypothetical protein
MDPQRLVSLVPNRRPEPARYAITGFRVSGTARACSFHFWKLWGLPWCCREQPGTSKSLQRAPLWQSGRPDCVVAAGRGWSSSDRQADAPRLLSPVQTHCTDLTFTLCDLPEASRLEPPCSYAMDAAGFHVFRSESPWRCLWGTRLHCLAPQCGNRQTWLLHKMRSPP